MTYFYGFNNFAYLRLGAGGPPQVMRLFRRSAKGHPKSCPQSLRKSQASSLQITYPVNSERCRAGVTAGSDQGYAPRDDNWVLIRWWNISGWCGRRLPMMVNADDCVVSRPEQDANSAIDLKKARNTMEIRLSDLDPTFNAQSSLPSLVTPWTVPSLSLRDALPL